MYSIFMFNIVAISYIVNAYFDALHLHNACIKLFIYDIQII